MGNNYPDLPAKEKERVKRREKKRRPKMGVIGRSVLTLAQIIKKRSEKESSPGKKTPKRGKRRKRRKKR